jgi:hypothetical protein
MDIRRWIMSAARSLLGAWLLAATLALGTSSAHADVVSDWNVIAVNASGASGLDPLLQARAVAMTHAAIYDAVNAIERRYSVYAIEVDAPPGASAEAAAGAAAHGVLVQLFPAQQANFNAALLVLLSRLPSDRSTQDGVAVGKQVAAKMLALRESDRVGAKIAYTPATGPGKWQPTPPALLPGLGAHWGEVAPFMIKDAREFETAGPPPLDSPEYAKQVNEVKRVGGKVSMERSADQTAAAVFWTSLGAPPWSQVARQAAAQKGSDLVDTARMYAMLNMTATDAFIACWRIKYAHNFWRPIHAIRNAEVGSNPAILPDSAWEPLIITPPFPEYVSGHAAWAGASERVLQTFLGADRMSFTVVNAAVGITRRYQSLSQMAQEVNDARVWGGVHFRISDEHGFELGHAVADYGLKRYMLPIER